MNFEQEREMAKLPDKERSMLGAIRIIIFLAGAIVSIVLYEERAKSVKDDRIATLESEKAQSERKCGEEKLQMQTDMQRAVDSVRAVIYNDRIQKLDAKSASYDSARAMLHVIIKGNSKILHH